MPHLLLVARRRQNLPGENLTEGLKCPLTGFQWELLPQVLQRNPLVGQKGGAPRESVRMLHLHVSRCEIAAPMQRAAAGRTPILPAAPRKANTFRDQGYCDCFFCGDFYDVKPDAFGDGCMTYYVGMMAEQMEAGDAEED
jgi:hypothetical protein